MNKSQFNQNFQNGFLLFLNLFYQEQVITHLVLVGPLIGQKTTQMKIGANSRKMSKINFCWFHSSKSWHFEWMMGVTMGSNHTDFNFFFQLFFHFKWRNHPSQTSIQPQKLLTHFFWKIFSVRMKPMCNEIYLLEWRHSHQSDATQKNGAILGGR